MGAITNGQPENRIYLSTVHSFIQTSGSRRREKEEEEEQNVFMKNLVTEDAESLILLDVESEWHWKSEKIKALLIATAIFPIFCEWYSVLFQISD